jgi:hypothetical protein
MDEAAYRSARGEINRLPCVFEKALLSRCAVCQLATSHALAERETVACTSPLARAECGALSGLLREKSAFALKLTSTQRILPHAMVMKIQCGGLQGLRQVLDAEAPASDVHKLVLLAREQFGDLAALPFSEIVQGVAAFQLRKRHKT